MLNTKYEPPLCCCSLLLPFIFFFTSSKLQRLDLLPGNDTVLCSTELSPFVFELLSWFSSDVKPSGLFNATISISGFCLADLVSVNLFLSFNTWSSFPLVSKGFVLFPLWAGVLLVVVSSSHIWRDISICPFVLDRADRFWWIN